jgi:hypothetical protein
LLLSLNRQSRCELRDRWSAGIQRLLFPTFGDTEYDIGIALARTLLRLERVTGRFPDVDSLGHHGGYYVYAQ